MCVCVCVCVCTVRVVAPSIACVPRLTCVRSHVHTVLAALARLTLCCYSYEIISYTVYYFSLICIYSCKIVIFNQFMHWYISGCCIHHSGGYNVLHDKLNTDGEGAVN